MEIIVRSTVIFAFLWLVARGTGKRELSEMTAFELILLVTMGDLIQQGVTQEDMSITGAILSVGTLAFWIIVFSAVSWRFKRARPILEGLPVVILRKGVPLMNVLEIERITLDELEEGARNQGIIDLSVVEIAVLEPDGKFSFLRAKDVEGEQHAPPDRHKG